MNDYAQRVCIACLIGRCARCIGRFSDRWCECPCWWTIKGEP